MMNLLKKNIHSFFGLSPIPDTFHLHSHHLHISGSGLAAASKDGNKVPHVLESTRLNATSNREIEVADGLMSCTESLGFESSDERRIMDDPTEEVKEMTDGDNMDDKGSEDGICGRKNKCDKKEKSFPPPLTTLNLKGQPSFFLRAVRKEGRLELTEVRIQGAQILHASRQDGRLRLHLIPDHLEDVEEEEMREKIRNETLEEEEDEEEEEEEERKRGMGESSEGVRRCHQVRNPGRHQQQHQLHLQICGVSIV